MDAEKGKDQLAQRDNQQKPVAKPRKRQKNLAEQKLLRLLLGHPVRNMLVAILLTLLILSAVYYFTAPGLGTSAGLAVGSWKGVTEGLSEGAADGKEEGLSAKDIEVAVTNKMTASKRLQLLLVDLLLTDLYQQGNDYAAIFGIRGEGVFTVDLTQPHAVYSADQSRITIMIPEPEFTPYLDDSSLEVIAEYTRPLFNGSTRNGYQGYLNTRNITVERVKSELSGYDALVEQAKASAIEQVTRLAKSVCGSKASVNVQFVEAKTEE